MIGIAGRLAQGWPRPVQPFSESAGRRTNAQLGLEARAEAKRPILVLGFRQSKRVRWMIDYDHLFRSTDVIMMPDLTQVIACDPQLERRGPMLGLGFVLDA